jgi:CheY-like chemotaxis protein
MNLSPLPHGLMLCDDLIFFSRVAGAARAIGTSVRMARTGTDLLTALRIQTPECIIVDLQNPGLDLTRLLQEIHLACPKMPFVVAYGSHVEAETLRAARKAGCDRVLPRSQFVVELESDLAKWLGVQEKTAESAGNQ